MNRLGCFCAAALYLCSQTALTAQNSIDLSQMDTRVASGEFKLGGTNPQGREINANSRYLTLDGKPWFPVMGEFHYTRYPRVQWEEELLKMKAGGVQIVSTYIFWIHHEEEEGQWDWSGNKDLRAFVELCQKHGLMVVIRLGPWAHGEVRNGGFPDWLTEKCGQTLRQNAEPYLGEVRKFYAEIYAQLHGLLWREGGPVVGVQLENELTRRPEHILALKTMAREIGFDVPLYTMTGWMSARVPQGEVLPLFGGYPDAFWASQVTGWDRRSRVNYHFTLGRDDATIGADIAGGQVGGNARAAAEQNPYLTCELGGGMAISYRRRPVITGDAVAALAMVKLGCGSNLLGYYMYQGGANPLGKLSTLQESTATNYPNDLPVINYDFQAPLREYGQRGPAYDSLRVMHLFLHDFGSDLATLPTALPEKLPANLDDDTTPRWAARSDGTRGYLFVNNYQPVEALPEKKGVQFALKLKDGVIKVPRTPVSIPSQIYFFWPFNMDLGGVRLEYATAQPLCRVVDTFVFAAADGIESEFVFDPASQSPADSAAATDAVKLKPGQLFSLRAKNGSLVKILLLSRAQALQAYKASFWGAERLFLSGAGLVFDGDNLRVQSRDPQAMDVLVYPALAGLVPGGKPEGSFTRFSLQPQARSTTAEWKRLKPAGPTPEVRKDKKGTVAVPADAAFDNAETWQISVPGNVLEGAHEAFLQIHYAGDVARAYIGDRLVDDDFYFGRPWEIGLRRFAPEVLEKGITLKILPLRKDAPIYIPADRLPPFGSNGEAVGVDRIDVIQEYEATLRPAGSK